MSKKTPTRFVTGLALVISLVVANRADASTTTFTGTLAPRGSAQYNVNSGLGIAVATVNCSGKGSVRLDAQGLLGSLLGSRTISCKFDGVLSTTVTLAGVLTYTLTETRGYSTPYTLAVDAPSVLATTT